MVKLRDRVVEVGSEWIPDLGINQSEEGISRSILQGPIAQPVRESRSSGRKMPIELGGARFKVEIRSG